MNIFGRIAKGDSATWTDTPFADTNGKVFTSQAYVLTYNIRGVTTLDLVGTPSGTGWSVSISTTQSGALTPGTYWWDAYLSKTGERVRVGSGSFAVTADLSAATAGYDGTTQNEKDLAAVRAERSARASNSFSIEYTIGNRSLKKEPLSALLQLEDRLVRMVRREREAEAIANGQGNPRRVGIKFVR